MKNLVFVESPTKANTLGKFLGKNFQVEPTFGHVRDLPKGAFGIDVYRNFEPKYVIPKRSQKRVNQLLKISKDAKTFWLCSDPDREGEAIAWHLKEMINEKLKIKNDEIFKRAVFHEITPEAVRQAFAAPHELDLELVDAWKARRILDRIVGYKLSPLLWAKIQRRLSAGRVQSVALRLICERAAEIDKFKPAEYWTIEAILKTQKAQFAALLVEADGKKISIKTKVEADEVVRNLENAQYKVTKVTKKEVKKNPAPPFTTSTLQQAASSKFGYSAKKTMKIAQNLYERGLITYMRTDSVFLANSATETIRNYIAKNFGANFLPPVPRKYRVKSKLAQEAHEAIRPTNVNLHAREIFAEFGGAHGKLYDLIWRRTVASQVREAILDQVIVDITAHSYTFRSTGSIVKFDGFLKVYADMGGQEEKVLPELAIGEILRLLKLTPSQHFTQPKDAYTDGTLVKALEAAGIGRPSTYAPIISTIIDRGYVEKIERKLTPTELGKTVNQFLVEKFPDIVDISFTAEMEANLDDIAAGREEWVPVIKQFYQPFEEHLAKVYQTAEKVKLTPQETSEICPKCGKKMVIRFGKFGKFLACSGFPACKTTMSYSQSTGLTCPNCGGNIVTKRTRKGRTFWGCSAYPKCTFASWTKPSIGAAIDNSNPIPAQTGDK